MKQALLSAGLISLQLFLPGILSNGVFHIVAGTKDEYQTEAQTETSKRLVANVKNNPPPHQKQKQTNRRKKKKSTSCCGQQGEANLVEFEIGLFFFNELGRNTVSTWCLAFK